MKCPFRTIRKVRYRHPEFTNPVDYDETTDFAECLEKQCPYYGQTVREHSPEGGWRTVTLPKCRRAENG